MESIRPAPLGNVQERRRIRRKQLFKKKAKHAMEENKERGEMRKISIPSHRYTPLRENWMKIVEPITTHLLLQIRFNLRTRQVELRCPSPNEDTTNLQKAADFVRAFSYGFDVDDALALIRLDNLFVESFEIKDVKALKGEHLSRAIGRLAGKGGKTKYTIENAAKVRIVLADQKVHILGSYRNIQVAMRAICNLILGSPPSKVYGQLHNIARSDRF